MDVVDLLLPVSARNETGKRGLLINGIGGQDAQLLETLDCVRHYVWYLYGCLVLGQARLFPAGLLVHLQYGPAHHPVCLLLEYHQGASFGFV